MQEIILTTISICGWTFMLKGALKMKLIQVYYYSSEAVRDQHQKEQGTLLGMASDPEDLLKLVGQRPKDSWAGYFQGNRYTDLSLAMTLLGAERGGDLSGYVWNGSKIS